MGMEIVHREGTKNCFEKYILRDFVVNKTLRALRAWMQRIFSE